ncbi:helix-turn-helix domain-containing protein [Streptomyces sp. NPDC017943]|uniref:helix-turn-helix domain-containing protein n=1 Tax=Streptomyces sp. NPDC017943 TaxID=3365019 RepID=UPI0037B35DAA
MDNAVALPTASEARALTDRIKVAVEGTWLLIQEAYTSRAWAALGYRTWDAYVDTEFRAARLALPKEERAETIQSLRSAGMSVRAISSATGVSVGTVHGELSRCSEMNTSSDVQGTDGKTYASARPAPPADAELLAGDDWVQPEGPGFEAAVTPPPKPKRRPLPEALTDAGRDLARAAERLARLTEDDRFQKNRDTSHHQLPELLGALDNTTRLLTAMNLPAAEASEEARRWWATSLHKISDALADVANTLEQEKQ